MYAYEIENNRERKCAILCLDKTQQYSKFGNANMWIGIEIEEV